MNTPITTTLNRIRKHGPCEMGWTKLLKALGKIKADDEPVTYAFIARSNGLDDALWCCRAEPEQSKTWRLFAVWCGRQVEHLMEDERSKNALDVAERHAKGEVTNEELAAARAAARNAARDASWDATRAVTMSVRNATSVAEIAVARDAEIAAWHATWHAARAGTWDAARKAQFTQFIKMVGE